MFQDALVNREMAQRRGAYRTRALPRDNRGTIIWYASLLTGACLVALMALPTQVRAQQGGAAPGSTQEQAADPFALYGYDDGRQAPGVSYDELENERLRAYEERRRRMLSGFANGGSQTSLGTSSRRPPTERDVQQSLSYDEAENARIEQSEQRINDREQSVRDSETGGNGQTTAAGAVGTSAVERNLQRIPESSVQQAAAFEGAIDDFQERTGMLAEDAECNTMASSQSACPMNEDVYEASFQSGLATDITNPNAPATGGAAGGSGTVPPVTTTMNDLAEPGLTVPPQYEDQFNQETLQPSYVPGEGSYGPNGDPINLDDISWAQYMQSEEERTMDWSKYLEYKTWGFDMSGFQWLGNNRFLMPKNFFLRESMELGPQQAMTSEDRQVAYSDRLITFRQYHDMIDYGYVMTGVRYFGDELGIQTVSYQSSRCNDTYDDDYRYWNRPYYCDTEAYELPVDFFERQPRYPGWRPRNYNDDR